MIDWLKATTFVKEEDVEPLYEALNIEGRYNKASGEEIKGPLYGKYEELEFVLTPAKMGGYWLEVSGSFHKLWEGGTNCGCFGFEDLVYTIGFVAHLCQVPPSAFTIKQIEFGVNLTPPPFETQTLLDNLIAYKSEVFAKMPTSRKGIGMEARLTEYRVKVYDKAAEMFMPSAICRIEVHIRRHTYQMIQVETLADLMDYTTMTRIGCELVAIVGNLVFDDQLLNEEQLKPSEQRIVARGRNPRFYENFSRNERHLFRKLLKEYGITQFTEVLSKSVSASWQELIGNESPLVLALPNES